MKFDVLNRWSGKVQFSAEIECADDALLRIKAGLALKWAYSSGADLRGAYLRGADLRGAYLRGANLSGAVLSYAYLSDANLSYANLSYANLRDANLRGAYLSGANLSGANLSGAYLSGANLSGANLSDANLRDADLSDADLSGANLSGANLSDANLRDADLSDECKVDGTFGIVEAGRPNNWPAWGYVEQEGTIRVRVGCRHFEIDEGRAYWSNSAHPEPENRREVLAALDYIEAVMELRGWQRKSS